MEIYTSRVERLQAAMRTWGVDLIFLNYGPDFTYLSGILRPIYYEILKTEGRLDHGPVAGRGSRSGSYPT